MHAFNSPQVPKSSEALPDQRAGVAIEIEERLSGRDVARAWIRCAFRSRRLMTMAIMNAITKEWDGLVLLSSPDASREEFAGMR